MKFKLLDVKIVGNNVQVAISHEDCEREVFGLPVDMVKDNKYIEEVKRIIADRARKEKPKVDKSMIGREFNIEEKSLLLPTLEEVQAKKKELSWQEFVAWAEDYGIKAKSEKEAVELFKQKINAAEL